MISTLKRVHMYILSVKILENNIHVLVAIREYN